MREEMIAKIRAHVGIDDSLIDYCCSPGKRFIYGNGAQAATCLGFFHEMDVQIHGLLTFPGYALPERKGYWKTMLASVEKVCVTDLNPEILADVSVLIATARESYDAARKFLKREGFCNIYTCAWERNQYLRDICYAAARHGELNT